MDFPGGSVVKKKKIHLPSRRFSFYPWVGKCPVEGNGNPLQYACLGNPMGRKAWRAAVHGVAKESDMMEGLNNNNVCE